MVRSQIKSVGSSEAGGTTRPSSGAALKGAAFAAAIGALAMSVPVSAQSGAQQDNIGEDAIDAVTQPLSDLNLRSKEIPLILLLAQDAPYELTEIEGCSALRTEIARLEEVLGPDADAPPESVGLVNRGLRTGGSMLGGFIPFRGIVRRISGAHSEEKRWDAAVYAGVARRSFLKGYMAGQECQSAEELSVQSARDLLGLSGGSDETPAANDATPASR